jgi:hypothetical protein
MVMGAVAIAAGAKMAVGGATVRGWPVVTGRLIERGVGPSTTSGASRPGRYFEPRAKFSYTVAGKTYEGTRISPVIAAYDESTAKKKAAALPEQPEVHYNPAAPADSYLETTSIGVAIVAILFGLLALLAGTGLFFSSRSSG